jgi:hypothetical protein
MATTIERDREGLADAAAAIAEEEQAAGSAPVGQDDPDAEPTVVEEQVSLRPVLAAALSASAAALVIGGMYGSWAARLFGLVMALGGAGLAALVLRSRRQGLAQLAVPPVVALVATLSVLPGGSPAEVPRLVRESIDAGNLLSPPIPFDPGVRPVLAVVLIFLAFGAAWVASSGGRPVLGVVLPIPLIALPAMNQPESEQILAGICAFLPLLAAFGVLYGGDTGGSSGGPGREFEVARALRGGAVMIGLAVALLGAGRLTFLFPAPTVDLKDKPQKPKSIPLAEARDRILLTVQAPPGFTGPWRTGVLDIYEDDTWKLAGGVAGRLQALPSDGTFGPASDADPRPNLDVVVTTDDLGPTAVVPVAPTTERVTFESQRPDLRVDPRAGVLRVPAGRAPSGLQYVLSVPPYPTAKSLSLVPTVTGDPDLLKVPPAPPAVRQLLTEAPPGPWDRLDHLRHALLDNITAAGAGSPTTIDAARVQDMLAGSKKGTPYEIVAAQALLARWAGIPSRIGFGYNGLNEEDGRRTVRPKNSAQWLEVRIDGYGWIPLLDVPPKAQADLDTKSEDDQRILPSNDVAVEAFVPVELDNPRLLFEQVRAVLFDVLPVLAVLLVAYLSIPFVWKQRRRRRRERWADALGPRARIAVAYSELRDEATDLSVGDPFATPIEYLSRVVEDQEHIELAWLVSRAMYGDLASEVTAEDADMAEIMAASLRRRLRQAQPAQVRAVAALSKASLRKPFSEEVPNVALPTPFADLTARLAGARRNRRLARRRKVATR